MPDTFFLKALLELVLTIVIVGLVYLPFVLFILHIKRANYSRYIKITALIGGVWGLLSLFPYLIMFGGYVEPLLLVKMLTLPAYLYHATLAQLYLYEISSDSLSVAFSMLVLLPVFFGAILGFLCALLVQKISPKE
ncbi:MAG: hypothetical protein Q8O53_00800 [Candidatus Moranbacteria bacterium]|nr:hypothetical protein [Candidatus Moranbacteria bacterium]